MKTRLTRAFRGAVLFLACLLAPGLGMLRADDAARRIPGYRELWVPAAHLDEAMKALPRAVLLTPEEFRTLARDGLRSPEEAPEKAPLEAAMRDLSFEGTVLDGVARLVATYTVESFAEGWTELPLPMPVTLLAELAVDDRAALRLLPPQAGSQSDEPSIASVLAVRGPGRHEVRAVFHLPVHRGPQGESIRFAAPASPVARLDLKLPAGAKVKSSLPFAQEGDSARFALPSGGGELHEISWSARHVGDITGAAILQTCRYIYHLDTTRVSADLGLVLSRDLAPLPSELRIPLPADTRVLSVEGTELLGWTVVDDVIQVRLIEGRHAAADLRILLELDIAPPAAGTDAEVDLPQPVAEGVHRASGTFALFGGDDALVKRILTSPLTVTAPEQIDASLRQAPDFVAGFSFPAVREAPRVTLAGVGRKFNCQLDTLVQLKRDAIFLDRTLTVVPVEGRVFETTVRLPEGEEVLDLALSSAAHGNPPVETPKWTRDTGDPRLIRVPWVGGLGVGESRTVLLTTRRDPTDWYTLGAAPMSLDFASAEVAGADAISGYVAVRFDESFRVETQEAVGLEARDGRTTPIEGALAWYRLRDYSLKLSVGRRPAELDAAVTAYAVPLQGTLEVEGQLDADIRHTPVAALRVKLPPAVAAQLRFDSPLLAEKRLDPATGEWTLAFHEERLGAVRLRFHLGVPFARESGDSETAAKSFQVSLPVLALSGARRQSGHWIIEANTDTELTFDAKGLDPVDSLRVPVVEGYQPRHRVIAAYQSRGDTWSLGISGTRHPAADLVTTVIEDLQLDTVASTDGPLRHQLQIVARSAGDQFLEIGLPPKARLWTLTLDGVTSKPVASSADSLRIQLPARDTNAAPYRVKLIYETPGEEWGGSGGETIAPPRFAEGIPVLRTRWQLHLPEGFDYQNFESNLREEFQIEDRTLLGATGEWMGQVVARGGVVGSRSHSTWNFVERMAGVADRYADDMAFKHEISVKELADRGEGINVGGSFRVKADATMPQASSAPPARPQTPPLSQAAPGVAGFGNAGGTIGGAEGTVALGAAGDIMVHQTGDAKIEAKRDSAARGTETDLEVAGVVAMDAGTGNLVLDPQGKPQVNAAGNLDSQTQAGRDVSTSLNLIVDQAQQSFETGDYDGALRFLADVLAPSADPNNARARELLRQIGDPELHSPAMNPELKEKTERMNRALAVARSATELGDYDYAQREYHKVLNDDKYNEAAIDGMIDNSRSRMRFYENPRTYSRSELLKTIADARQLPVPVQLVAPGATEMVLSSGTDRVQQIENKLRTIIIPSIEFVDTPLEDALTFLREQSIALDTTPNVADRGISIVPQYGSGGGPAAVAPPPGGAAPGGFDAPGAVALGGGGGPGQTRVNLKISNVPLGEALRYTTSLAGLKYKVDQHAVLIIPASGADALQKQKMGPVDSAISGLVPLDFQLPASGSHYVFSGLHAPNEVTFRYVNWERQVRLAWVWMLLGAGTFLGLGVRWLRRPHFVGALGVAVLALGPLAAGGLLLNWCNAVLLGWLAGWAGWLLWRWIRRSEQAATSPSTAQGNAP